jgi:transposase-like protein
MTAATVAIEPVADHATCPLCRRSYPTEGVAALDRGDSWVCPTCEVRWDAARLETVAAYARYVAGRAKL